MSYLDHKLTVLGGQTKLRHPADCQEGCVLDKCLSSNYLVSRLPDGLYMASATAQEKVHLAEVYVRRADLVG